MPPTSTSYNSASLTASAAGAPVRGAGRVAPALAELLTRRWLALFAVLLAGLAIGGRGFAYIGLPPLFISEVTLLMGGGVLLLQRRWRALTLDPTAVLVVGLLGWTAWRTLPYLGTHGLDAIRDAMLVGYAVAGLVVAGVLVSQPTLLPWLLGKYQRFVKVFLCVMPGLWVVDQAFGASIPGWPWAPHVGIINLKPGDMPVHLGGIAALATLGLFRGRSRGWMLLLFLLVAMTGSVTRGGLLAFLSAFTVAAVFRPTSRWARRFVLIAVGVATLTALADVRVQVPGREREFSARQLVQNMASVVESHDAGDLNDTRTWRLQWWGDIVDYTIGGEYRWGGKGFGVNLATADGYQVSENDSLRSPHNGHLNILARGGLPALGLWVAIQAAWLLTLFRGYLDARWRGDANWSGWFVFLGAYWLALMINAAFDVYFEGPMGGIWYWSVIGLGIASAWIYRHHPEVMHAANAPHATPRTD